MAYISTRTMAMNEQIEQLKIERVNLEQSVSQAVTHRRKYEPVKAC